MVVGGVSATSNLYADQTTRGAGPIGTSTLSNATPGQMQATRVDLYNEGKITLKQSGQMMVMDGEALASANGGSQVAGSSDLYKMVDESVAEQKSFGTSFNAQANVASYTSLQSILEQYDQNKQSGISAVA